MTTSGEAASEPVATTAGDKPSAPRWKRWGKEVLIFLAIFGAIRLWQGRSLASGDAPELALTTIDGQPFVLADDKPTLVHFMATWCPACKAMHSSVESMAESHHVVAIAVQCGDGETLRRGMGDAGWLDADGHSPIPTVADPNGALSRAWGVSAFPTTFVVSNGKIRAAEVGFTSQIGMWLRMKWAAWMS